MAQQKTHFITLVTEKGNKRVKVHETLGSWVVGKNEAYSKDTGRRNGSSTCQRYILINTLFPIVKLPPPFTTD